VFHRNSLSSLSRVGFPEVSARWGVIAVLTVCLALQILMATALVRFAHCETRDFRQLTTVAAQDGAPNSNNDSPVAASVRLVRAKLADETLGDVRLFRLDCDHSARLRLRFRGQRQRWYEQLRRRLQVRIILRYLQIRLSQGLGLLRQPAPALAISRVPVPPTIVRRSVGPRSPVISEIPRPLVNIYIRAGNVSCAQDNRVTAQTRTFLEYSRELLPNRNGSFSGGGSR
jgi:hypothetical protein